MKSFISIIILSSIILLSCDKRKEDIIQSSETSSNALFKFINVYTSLTPSGATPATGPAVDIYINNKKINAAAVGYASPFPAPAGYASITASPNTNLKIVLNRAGVSNSSSDILYEANYNFTIGSYTTMYLVDTLPYTNPSSPIVFSTSEKVSSAKNEFIKLRFANMSPTTDIFEVFSKRLQTVIATGARFKTSTDFMEFPLIRATDTLQLRKVGTTAVLAELRPFNPVSSRVYTIYSRGLVGTTTGLRALTLTSYTNK